MKLAVAIGLIWVVSACSSKQNNTTITDKKQEKVEQPDQLMATANDLNYQFSGCKAHQ
jgi:hypothetical protein